MTFKKNVFLIVMFMLPNYSFENTRVFVLFVGLDNSIRATIFFFPVASPKQKVRKMKISVSFKNVPAI